MRVKEIMSTPLVAVTRDTPLKQVARTLVAHRITGVPVVEDERVVGIVSQSNLVEIEQEAEAECLDRSRRLRRFRRTVRRRAHRRAGDVMVSPAIAVDVNTSAVGAAWLMTVHDVNRLVVTESERPVGVVTRSDLVRAFGRSDDEVRREIVENVLPALGISANEVEVTVANGEVALRGSVEDELEACCVPHAVRSVMGVVEVFASLTPRHPHVQGVSTPCTRWVDAVADEPLHRRP